TWTWDTLLETAKKLTNKENKIYGFGAPLNSHEGYYNFIFQNGGYILSDDKKKCGYDDKKTLEALRWYIDLGLKEGVSPTQKEFDEVSPLTLFESGKLAMGIFGSWNVANFKQNEYVRENCDIAVLPMGEKRASVYNGLGNAIGYNTKHPEEAWKFVEFLGGKEANILQAEYGAAIPAYKGIDEKWAEVTKEFNARAHVEMLDYAEILPYSNRTARWKVIEDDLWPRVWAGQANLDEVSKRMDKDIEEVLAED
ncbi:ABC transporter substrate-binding protein, partial [Clostridium perfringens]